MFVAERRGKTVPNEDSITGKVFGSLGFLGDRVLVPFLNHFVGEAGKGDFAGLCLEFWPTFQADEETDTLKPYRLPDVAIRAKTGRVIAFIESKWDAEVDLDQIVDEYKLCGKYSSRDPHLLVVTPYDPGNVIEAVHEELKDNGRVEFIRWAKINGWIKEFAKAEAGLTEVERRLLGEVSGLLDDLGQRASRGVEPETLSRIVDWREAATRYLGEVEILVGELEEDLKSAHILHLQQAGGQRVYHDGTTRQMDSRDWLPSYYLFPFARSAWYLDGLCKFETDSYLYVVFFLDRSEIQVGYWGTPSEVAEDVARRPLPATDLPSEVPAYSGAAWMAAARKANSSLLDTEALASLVGDSNNHFDLFYSIPLTEFRRGNEDSLKKQIEDRMALLANLVVSLGLRSRRK